MSTKDKNPPSPDEYLNRNMPDRVKDLHKQARQALRERARAKWMKENPKK